MNVEMSYDQISKLAYQTCQWWNSVFVQAKRFINASENNDEMPWDDSNATFIADRLFLIMAIYHSFEGIKKLNIELQRENDFSLDPVVKSLDNIVNFETIKQLRNMNEHGLDYLIGKGRAKNYYETTVETATRKIHTNAGMTIVWGDEDLFLFGGLLFSVGNHHVQRQGGGGGQHRQPSESLLFSDPHRQKRKHRGIYPGKRQRPHEPGIPSRAEYSGNRYRFL